MSRLHCALNTNNFKASVDFYTKLFGQHPAKLEDGYAKFSCDDPSVNLTLNQVSTPIHQNAINHLGIEVEDAKAVIVAKERLEQLGLPTKLEEDVDCCYAIQDKVWVTDSNGHRREFFFVKDEGSIGNEQSEECCPTD